MAPPAPASPQPDPRPRPRGRTAALIACAAALGVLTGICAGYTVQAERTPTPLPPLSQAQLPYPEPLAEGKGPEPLPAAHDRLVRTDGDLRKLLLRKPKGAGERPFPGTSDGWLSPYAYAKSYDDADRIFLDLLGMEIRRVANTGWRQDSTRLVWVSLLQFRDEQDVSSSDFLADQRQDTGYWTDNFGDPLPGVGDGRFYVYDRPLRVAGHPPLHAARATGRRGDIVMDLWIYDTKPVGKDTVTSLARKQMERL